MYECWFCGHEGEDPVYCDNCGERINGRPEGGINWGLITVLACLALFWVGVFKLLY